MVICVTHRLLCPDDFLERLDRIAAQHPYAIVLREKDLSESEYEALARDCLRICQKHAVPLNLNSQIAVARRIGCDGNVCAGRARVSDRLQGRRSAARFAILACGLSGD